MAYCRYATTLHKYTYKHKLILVCAVVALLTVRQLTWRVVVLHPYNDDVATSPAADNLLYITAVSSGNNDNHNNKSSNNNKRTVYIDIDHGFEAYKRRKDTRSIASSDRDDAIQASTAAVDDTMSDASQPLSDLRHTTWRVTCSIQHEYTLHRDFGWLDSDGAYRYSLVGTTGDNGGDSNRNNSSSTQMHLRMLRLERDWNTIEYYKQRVEATFADKLSGPSGNNHIVQVYSLCPYSVISAFMPHLLRQKLQKRQMSDITRLKYAIQLATGLSHIQAQNLAHLDLQWKNILWKQQHEDGNDGQGRAYINDFHIGSVDMHAPMMHGGSDNDELQEPWQIDMYALGSLYFEIVTKKPRRYYASNLTASGGNTAAVSLANLIDKTKLSPALQAVYDAMIRCVGPPIDRPQAKYIADELLAKYRKITSHKIA